MRLLDQIELAVKGVFASFFSLLSNTVSIFVGLVFFGLLISLSVGVGEFVEKYYTRTMALTSLLVFQNPEAAQQQPFDKAYRKKIERIPGIERIFYHGIDFVELQISQRKSVTAPIRSAVAGDPEIERLELVAGTNIPTAKDPFRPPVVLPLIWAQQLSDSPAKELIGLDIVITFLRGVDVEKEFEKESLYGRIVGVVHDSPDQSVYVPYQVHAVSTAWLKTDTNPKGEKKYVFPKLVDPWNAVKDRIADDTIAYPNLRIHARNVGALLAARDHFGDRGLTTTSVLDEVAAIRQLRNYAVMVGSAIGLITLVASICSIFNTLLASVERRTREIGILRSLGASNLNVLTVFLLEGAVNALIGGVIAATAIFFGTAAANQWIIKRLEANEEFARLAELDPALFAFPWWLPWIVVGIGLFASLLAAIGPAIRACLIQPTAALRHE